jgi:CRP-like cAMP-binding protein
VSKGEPAAGFHLLLEGAAEVRAYGKTVSRLHPGQFFGEMSVLDKQPRPDDVVAVEPSRVLFLSTPSFETLVSTNPRIALEMLQGFSRRLRIVDGWLSD